MKRPKLVVGSLLAMLALGVTAIAAVSASAETVWLCNEKTIPNAKECLILSENLELMKFEDMKAGSAIDCPAGAVKDEGWVGPGATDETTSVTFTGCAPETGTNACEKVVKIESVNLPWITTLELISGVAWDTITAHSGGGEPGFAITCKTILGEVKDTCTQPAGHPLLVELTNLPLEGTELGLVTLLYLETPREEAEFWKCSVGGALSGLMIGERLLAASINNTAVTLEFSEP